MIVGLNEHRESRSARIARKDGLTLDCAALPLPDGATLLTSLDVTASANVERALTERNLALVAAEKLRNDFVNHVSYELRTPLTNIIGFTQLLAAGGRRPAQRQAARICRLHNQFVACIARHHRRHSRSRLDRRRRAGVASRERRRRGSDEGGRGRRAGPAQRSGDRDAHGVDGRRRRVQGRRAAGAPGSVQSPVQRDQLFRTRADGDSRGDAARRGDRVQSQRSRARNSRWK